MIVVGDAGSVLVHADDRGIDHLHRRIMTGGQRFHDLVPDASPPPPDEAIVTSGTGTICGRSRHGAPERRIQKMPLNRTLTLGRTVPETVLTSGLAQSREGTGQAALLALQRFGFCAWAAEGSPWIEQHGRCERYARAWCSDDAHGATFGSNALLAIRVSPIAGLKNCYARLQEGKVIAMGN